MVVGYLEMTDRQALEALRNGDDRGITLDPRARFQRLLS